MLIYVVNISGVKKMILICLSNFKTITLHLVEKCHGFAHVKFKYVIIMDNISIFIQNVLIN